MKNSKRNAGSRKMPLADPSPRSKIVHARRSSFRSLKSTECGTAWRGSRRQGTGGDFPRVSTDGHFLAGSWQMSGNGCLCMLSDVTLDVRKPL